MYVMQRHFVVTFQYLKRIEGLNNIKKRESQMYGKSSVKQKSNECHKCHFPLKVGDEASTAGSSSYARKIYHASCLDAQYN